MINRRGEQNELVLNNTCRIFSLYSFFFILWLFGINLIGDWKNKETCREPL